MLAAIAMHVLVAALVLPRSLGSPLKEEQAITVELVKDPNPPEKAKAEASPPAKPPTPEKAPGASAPIPPPTSAPGTPPANAKTLRPVLLFGDKDHSPRKSPDGQSAESDAAPPARPDPPKQPPPHTLALTTDAQDQVPQSTSANTAKPEDASPTQQDPALHQAKTIFSTDATSNRNWTIAMGFTPRGDRVGQLCSTELGEQLTHGSPAYTPQRLPQVPLPEGTVLDVPGMAFEANLQWYDVSFRCEVDVQATRVLRFAFRVGKPIPRSEWVSRGLPSD